jgi:hypothetical protein
MEKRHKVEKGMKEGSLIAVKTKAVGTFRRVSHAELATDGTVTADVKEGMITGLESIDCDDDPFTDHLVYLTCRLKKVDYQKEREIKETTW